MTDESKVRKLFQNITYLEDIYNKIVIEKEVKLPGPCSPLFLDDMYTIKDKKVVDTVIKYYGNKINKLKDELKKELNKKL